MRKRKDIEKDGTRKEDLIIEVLLDVRELLKKGRGGRPKMPTKNSV